MNEAPADPIIDPWARFRAATRARIGLGRAGDAVPTREALALMLAHARARDAVHGVADFDRLAVALAPLETVGVHSQAADRAIYLRRPDLGRRLSAESCTRLRPGDYDAVFVVADGLSARAIDAHAAPMIGAALARLPGWRIAPVVLARQARVAIGDDVGGAMGARMAVVLVGERPGLTVQDSLGIYLTYQPRPGRTDAERNCLSNIHGHGLPIGLAADKLAWLMNAARGRQLTGVALKEGFLAGVVEEGKEALLF
jgi:ethanolamine ammonia-lyase small subunit